MSGYIRKKDFVDSIGIESYSACGDFVGPVKQKQIMSLPGFRTSSGCREVESPTSVTPRREGWLDRNNITEKKISQNKERKSRIMLLSNMLILFFIK